MKTLSAYKMQKTRAERRKLKMVRTSALLVIWLLIMVVTVFHGNVASGEIREPRIVVVTPGDTLWAMAGQHAPRGMDRRDYLDQVLIANNLTRVLVYPGQEIVLP